MSCLSDQYLIQLLLTFSKEDTQINPDCVMASLDNEILFTLQ